MFAHTLTHTHTHTNIYIYIIMRVIVVCIYNCTSTPDYLADYLLALLSQAYFAEEGLQQKVILFSHCSALMLSLLPP